MQVSKSITTQKLDELIAIVQKMKKEKRTFNFSGNIDNVNEPNTESYSVNCTEESDEI